MQMKSFFSSSKLKAQGLSLNVIIIAILVLIVLVVLVLVFSGKMTLFGKGAVSCSSRSGTCAVDVGTSCPANSVPLDGTDCSKSDPPKVCCIPMDF